MQSLASYSQVTWTLSYVLVHSLSLSRRVQGHPEALEQIDAQYLIEGYFSQMSVIIEQMW